MAAEALTMELKRQVAELAIAQNKHNENLAKRLQEIVDQAEKITLDTNEIEAIRVLKSDLKEAERQIEKLEYWKEEAECAFTEALDNLAYVKQIRCDL